MELAIQDNGQGFNPGKVTARKVETRIGPYEYEGARRAVKGVLFISNLSKATGRPFVRLVTGRKWLNHGVRKVTGEGTKNLFSPSTHRDNKDICFFFYRLAKHRLSPVQARFEFAFPSSPFSLY